MLRFTIETGLPARWPMSTSIQSPRTECFSQNDSRLAARRSTFYFEQLSLLLKLIDLRAPFVKQRTWYGRIREPIPARRSLKLPARNATCKAASKPVGIQHQNTGGDHMQAGIGAM